MAVPMLSHRWLAGIGWGVYFRPIRARAAVLAIAAPVRLDSMDRAFRSARHAIVKAPATG